ncbi:unnamed protein product [Hydatigera taeniaeformis]|uniref:Chitin-binding type-1 domain-containing protein n=1 Tax=Hydatigena taeniaeformis TaxID=6205 RepID=A0A0R3XAL8_HYDTA|nr:unnamed protein product [Hydatigera taeniaeformis]
MPGYGVAIYPNSMGGFRGGMGYSGHPYGPQAFRGGMGPGVMPYGGYMPLAPRGMPMQGGLEKSPFSGPIGPVPFAGTGFHGLGAGHPFDRCNGGNCGYWGGCHGGHCGEFYDFRPCHTPECFDGPIHGFDCMDGSCGRVCNGHTCQDFGKQSCSDKSSSETEDKESAKKEA